MVINGKNWRKNARQSENKKFLYSFVFWEKIQMKAKAKIEKGRFRARVKYPLVGGAELEIGPTSKIKAIIKLPFIASAKFLGFLKLKKKNGKNKEKK